ncbi:hypothetical protein Enr10x_55740 [Gimesia panareensis]|uniref:WW domain-containing protein n=1 Tax=Gimesia panareensis TaxID=2527978 RepID=A0A517QF23_9PLAN|nr:PcfJ domain-containing protein [Gimesia panareensis]QDT30214.1 hypothetical protein Enr10x_55740 [Gimesia panareensis]
MSRLTCFRRRLPFRKQAGCLRKLRRQAVEFKTARNAPRVEEFLGIDEAGWPEDWEYDYYDSTSAADRFYYQFQQALESQWKRPVELLIPRPSAAQVDAVPDEGEVQLARTDLSRLVEKLESQADAVARAERQCRTRQVASLVPQTELPAAIRRLAAQSVTAPTSESLSWLSLVVFFKPFWIRSAESWTGQSKASLIQHLFVNYPVPEFLIDAWDHFQGAAEKRFKWQHWLIILGQGGSLSLVPGKTWRKMQQYLFDVPWHELPEVPRTPALACLYAEVRRLGGDVQIWKWLALHPAFAIDPTEAGGENQMAFWYETVNWLIRHRDQLSAELGARILDWSMHEFLTQEALQRRFTWKGRTFEAICHSARQFRRRIIFAGEYYSHFAALRWQGHGWDWAWSEESVQWKVRELTTGLELQYEGKVMRHCVAGYASCCAKGASAILRLTRNGQPCLTLEVDPRLRSLVQARGKQNREATAEERRIIDYWVSQTLQMQADAGF